MGTETNAGPFQVCGACKRAWVRWDEFIQDPAIRLLGFQFLGPEHSFNLLVFEHACGSSISVLARRLRYLLPQLESESPLPVLFGTDECRGHCRFLEDLDACGAHCSNVRDRALILVIQCLKKRAQEARATA